MKSVTVRSRIPNPTSLTTRQLNRLILAVAMVLLIGVPTLAVVYFLDRAADAGPSLVDRKIGELEDAVRKSPNSISTRLELAGAYGAAERYGDATAQLNSVLEVEPDNKTALVTRGDLYLTQSKLDEAARDYEHVIALSAGGEFAKVDTQLHQAYYSLGEIQLKQGKAADAVKNLEAALVIRQTDADTLNLLGQAYLASGDAAKAVDPLRAAILFVPVGWRDPYAALADAYSKLGKADEATWAGAMAEFAAGKAAAARTALMTITSGDAALDANVGLGLVTESLGDRAGALAAYQRALAIDPQNFTALAGQTRTALPSASPAPQTGS